MVTWKLVKYSLSSERRDAFLLALPAFKQINSQVFKEYWKTVIHSVVTECSAQHCDMCRQYTDQSEKAVVTNEKPNLSAHYVRMRSSLAT